MISKKDIQVFRDSHRILLHTKEFICLRPHFNLSGYISNFNITFPSMALFPDSFTSIPCACASLAIEADCKSISVNLEGPATKPFIIGEQTGQLELLITIEFKPAGLYALTGISQSELVDQTIPFDTVNPRLSKMLSDVVEISGTIYELVSGLDILMLEHMVAEFSPQLLMALTNVIDSAGSIPVKNVSGDVYYSERHLNRIFKQHIGVSVKSFSRIVRIHNAFRLLERPASSVALVSDLLGFHDLPHFVRDFRLVSGVTPQEYRNNMSDFYINTQRF